MTVKISRKFKTVFYLQTLGWGIYFIITSFFHSFFVHGMHDELLYVKQAFTFALLGYVFSFLLFFYYESFKIINRHGVVIVASVLILSYLFTLLWMTTYKIIFENIWNIHIRSLLWSNIHHYSFDKTFVLLIWSGIYYIISYWTQLKKEKEKTLLAEAALNEAKYNILKYQVNPHFLFNALNSIIGMIDEDKDKAKKMVTGLSEFFRYSLNKGERTEITLKEEVEGIENYLEIEKERYEENLIVHYNISDSAAGAQIPGFIVHPLVENAIKYGMKTSQMPLNITISAHIDDNSLIIKVTNSGRLTPHPHTESGTGIGITNIIERLKLSYGNEAGFTLNEIDNRVEASIVINNIQTRDEE